MEELRNIEQKIAWELIHHPQTRGDDWLLMMRLYQDFYGIKATTSFTSVCLMHSEAGLPTFESVTRLRRKLQEKDPEMYGASKRARQLRHEREVEMYDYVQGNV